MLKNHFVFVIDASGSMNSLRYDVVQAFNNQLNEIKKASFAEGQESRISLYFFNSTVKSPVYFDLPVNKVPLLQQHQFSPFGSTALWDAVGTAINDVNYLPETADPETSIVVMPLTDGEENASRRFTMDSLQKLMQKVIATDRWTFAFLVPRYGVRTLQSFGIPMGNIQPWDATQKGVREYDVATRSALSNFVQARKTGQKATKSFFKADLTNVDPATLKKQLKDVSTSYLRLVVDNTSAINSFVEKTTGKKYVKGTGLYQLTKPEDIQDYKEIIIQDKDTNALFGGPTVRGVLGFPDWGTIRVHPGNHAHYNIFVQSTSVNRKLLAGTAFLLKN